MPVGIPDRSYLGQLAKLTPGQLADLVIQRHIADRAGEHYDWRLEGPEGLYSWASRKPMPAPGQKILAVQQPLHSREYKDFEGEIPEGYGKGRVQKHFQSKLLFTKVSPHAIHFTIADARYPERFVLIKPPKFGDKDWLLLNTTPTEPLPYAKVRYTKIPAEDVESKLRQMQAGDSVEAKVDGASSLIKILKDGVEVTSYRTSSETGRPIIHTERVFHRYPRLEVPKELVGTVLKGELYGVQGDKVIPPSELGGLLNATIANSIQAQKAKGIKLKDMVYDIQRLGNKDIDWREVPREERRRMIQDVLRKLPDLADTLHPTEAATTPEEARKLWEAIRTGKHPLTREGVVFWPATGRPWKGKLLDERDVHIVGTFPGSGKYADRGIGGFIYALEPGGPPVGKVGTGLSDMLREQAYKDPQAVIGRIARIRAQGQFPSGAYRAPALISLHEDYPTQKVAKVTMRQQIARAVRRVQPPKSKAQADAGNYRKGLVRFHGFEIMIETPAGQLRQPEWPPLKNHYGYFRRSLGKDGDQVDVFLGPDPDVEVVYVVDQKDPQTGKFDEHKCMLGFRSLKEAREAYQANYSPGWKGLGAIVPLTMDQFKFWLSDFDTTKPLAKHLDHFLERYARRRKS